MLNIRYKRSIITIDKQIMVKYKYCNYDVTYKIFSKTNM